jgi:hypothetical protein
MLISLGASQVALNFRAADCADSEIAHHRRLINKPVKRRCGGWCVRLMRRAAALAFSITSAVTGSTQSAVDEGSEKCRLIFRYFALLSVLRMELGL